MICVLGRDGQVARAISERWGKSDLSKSSKIHFLAREHANFEDPEQVVVALAALNPKFVINAVAYTAVDQAEKEPDLALQINAVAVGRIAEYCASKNIPLIHYSTDYVYGGHGDQPQIESEPIEPLNTYGSSKAAGEAKIRAAGGPHLIFRTSWVYHNQGKNFLKTMLRLGAEQESLSIVSDQIGSPTAAVDIADATLAIIDKIVKGESGQWGTYNLAGNGVTSWFGLAEEVFQQARALGFELKVRDLKAVSSQERPSPTKRPLNSRLNQDKLWNSFHVRLPVWQTSVRECLEQIRSMPKA